MKHRSNRKITVHARQRLSERTDLNLVGVNSSDFFFEVYNKGYRLNRFEGDLYSYLLTKRIDGSLYDIRVYKNIIYVIDTRQKRIITVYPIPSNLLPVEAYFVSSASPCIIVIRGIGENGREYVYEDGSFGNDIALAMEFRTNQRAQNFIKNNHIITTLKKQGCEVIVLDLS